MKYELHPFQLAALSKLRATAAQALGGYYQTHVLQIISYQAPTGAGKTIIITSLIEHIFCGDEEYAEQPEAIFLWLSDSPQLNEQSRSKIETVADKVRPGQCVTITEDSFDREVLEDGTIYFLNTQKLSKSSKLGQHSDGRQYTIWETLSNTALRKSDRFYVIIDEAHRGAQKKTDMAKANSIMQKFLKGSPEDGLPPMPVVIGMSATPERFDALAKGIGTSTTYKVVTGAADVRASGLLKDRIVISYPETDGNDMAVLQAAAEEWKDKWEHWTQFCKEQKYAYVNPVFVIQVLNGSKTQVTATDMDECLRIIEEATDITFSEGEVVHAFGEGTPAQTVNGLNVPYCEPSRISEDRKIKVVFFKETLSTGWDCPRAEAMMSFRHANDHTYIAQLLGRMIRTPRAQRVQVDESLNDVHLFLPRFNEDNVKDVIKALEDEEGAAIPTDIEAEQLGQGAVNHGLMPTYETRPKQGQKKNPMQISLFDDENHTEPVEEQGNNEDRKPQEDNPVSAGQPQQPQITVYPQKPEQEKPTEQPEVPQTQTKKPQGQQSTQPQQERPSERREDMPGSDIDRRGVVKAVNGMGLLTYKVRSTKVTDYPRSMFLLANLLTHTRLDMDCKQNVLNDIADMIREYVLQLKQNGQFEVLAAQVMQFKLNSLVFDPFGKQVKVEESGDLYVTTDADIDRQFRLAESKLGNEGVGSTYIDRYQDEEDDFITLKIGVILFVVEKENMDRVRDYAENKFHELQDAHRKASTHLPDKEKKKYDDIVSNGGTVTQHSFRLPETLSMKPEMDGTEYFDHLYVEKYGSAMIKLNGWEAAVIEEEEKQDEFVCWIRNPSRGSWSLCLPYDEQGETKAAYPDFLIIRREGDEYVVDVLEPHNPNLPDNLGKAKAFAEYATNCQEVGRVQLIQIKKNSLGEDQPFRLDLSKSSVRDAIRKCSTLPELTNVYEQHGYFM